MKRSNALFATAIIVSIVTPLMLVACQPVAQTEPAARSTRGEQAEAEYYTTILGCDVFYIKMRHHSNFMMTVCNGSESSVQYQQGKTQSMTMTDSRNNQVVSNPVGQSIKPAEGVAEAAKRVETELLSDTTDEQKILELARKIQERQAVLDKLTDHEKDLLGIESHERKPEL